MALKRQFGSRLSRLIGGGATLCMAEQEILQAAVTALPQDLRCIVEAQFQAYNLVHREVDGRALNFYRKARGKVTREGLPVLPSKAAEAPLIRLTVRMQGSAVPIHAVLTAVSGRAFCLTIDRPLEPHERDSSVRIEHVAHAWKSNLEVRAEV